MKPGEVHALAVVHGLTHEQAITATAIAWAESGLRPDAIGDVDLEDAKWGPSVGLYQVRSLRADTGTGKERDVERLGDPSFNTRSMVAISAGGTNWTPWSVFKNGRYRNHLDAVRAAVEGGALMETWHPRAHDASANRAGGTYIGVAPKIVLHTVEGSGRYSYNPASYYGNPYWPHATIDSAGIHQHLPIDASAFALANSAGGAETNRANAIQCEILWFAGRIDELPDATMRHLADWVTWVAAQTGTPLTFAEFRGEGAYGENAPQRFSAREWLDFTGVCGHQHVPENDHWDPGAFPVDRLRALLAPSTTPSKEDEMFSTSPVRTMHIIASHSGLLLTSSGEHHGAGVIQRRADGSLNQRWEVWGHDDGTISLVNRAGGFALDRPDYSTEAGTMLQVARTEHNAAQRWSLDEFKPHLARLWAPGTNRCLDVHMRSVDDGAGVQLWYGLTDEDDPRHQQFILAPTV